MREITIKNRVLFSIVLLLLGFLLQCGQGDKKKVEARNNSNKEKKPTNPDLCELSGYLDGVKVESFQCDSIFEFQNVIIRLKYLETLAHGVGCAPDYFDNLIQEVYEVEYFFNGDFFEVDSLLSLKEFKKASTSSYSFLYPINCDMFEDIVNTFQKIDTINIYFIKPIDKLRDGSDW
ncbi:hypothetical protein [Parvicella tangerina]|uniref:Uncharacterized protein n=1 Tax=Parvicella tangerina TaxID=2829795 RepID=A0A916JP21_9FLAO|nr:hypothetical protein [Parvicella tangerina]CAG5084052.1 hypothetical protein CRYO30217_02362 [Parvicella tangerina]